MRIRFYVDLDTQLPHIFNHDVTEDEATEVILSASQHVNAKQGALMAIVQTQAGRHLRVIYRKETSGIFVITAYDLGNKAVRAYRRRQRRRRQ